MYLPLFRETKKEFLLERGHRSSNHQYEEKDAWWKMKDQAHRQLWCISKSRLKFSERFFIFMNSKYGRCNGEELLIRSSVFSNFMECLIVRECSGRLICKVVEGTYVFRVLSFWYRSYKCTSYSGNVFVDSRLNKMIDFMYVFSLWKFQTL